MASRGVNTDWQLVAKIKKVRNQTSLINIDAEQLGRVLEAKEQDFNNSINPDLNNIKSHPTMVSKYLKRFFKND